MITIYLYRHNAERRIAVEGPHNADLEYAAGWKPGRYSVPMLARDDNIRHDHWSLQDYTRAIQYHELLDEAMWGEFY
jgi:hypothetical protein